MADRNTFLNQIREQAARGRAHRVAVNPQATAAAAYVGGGADPVGTLLAEWTAAGGRGLRVAGAVAAREFIGQWLDRCAARSALIWNHPLLEQLDVAAVLDARGVALLTSHDLERRTPGERWPAALAADVGITSVNWAVAETGSLALCAGPGQGRAVSLLPPGYLAIVEPGQIVPDLFDLFERIEPCKPELPSNITLVTGPSKTGDIELKLTTGVHGPGDVTLLVVE